MRSRRLCVALAAVTSVTLGLTSPVAAQAATSDAAAATTAPAGNTAATGTTSNKATATATNNPNGSSGSSDSGSKDDSSQMSSDTAQGLSSGENAKKPTAQSKISKECQAEIDKAAADHKAAVKDGTAGSSFMGPGELAQGVLAGYGSSGLPKKPQCQIDAEANSKPQNPSWAKWNEVSPEVEEVFQWISATLAVAGGLLQFVIVLAKIDPSFLNPLKDALTKANIRF